MDFGRSNGEIGRKMANGQLLFLALYHTPKISSKAMWSTTIGRLAALEAIYMKRHNNIVSYQHIKMATFTAAALQTAPICLSRFRTPASLV